MGDRDRRRTRPRAAPSTSVPPHLDPAALRIGWAADAASVALLLRGEMSTSTLRRCVQALLDSEQISRDGAGRVPRPG